MTLSEVAIDLDRLRQAIGEAILGDAELERESDGAAMGRDEHLALVRRASDAESIVREILQQTVTSARSHGASWAALGAELSLSRQAVQQRFGGTRPSSARAAGSPGASGDEGGTGETATIGNEPLERWPVESDGRADERWLGPVTAFDEMAELNLAGRMGWRTVEVGMLKHRMVRTDTQWEHRRALVGRAVRRAEANGWLVACRAFPWVYLVRDRGVAPDLDPGPRVERNEER